MRQKCTRSTVTSRKTTHLPKLLQPYQRTLPKWKSNQLVSRLKLILLSRSLSQWPSKNKRAADFWAVRLGSLGTVVKARHNQVINRLIRCKIFPYQLPYSSSSNKSRPLKMRTTEASPPSKRQALKILRGMRTFQISQETQVRLSSKRT